MAGTLALVVFLRSVASVSRAFAMYFCVEQGFAYNANRTLLCGGILL